jgi:pimeloyl-ACP methyl ester carboxylesterase
MPTLVMGGTDDRIIPSCYARKMAESIPGSEFVELARCGHNPFQEMPEVVLPKIIDFLSRKDGSRQTSATVGHADCSPATPVELCV